MQDHLPSSACRGAVRAYQELPSGLRIPTTDWNHNLVTYEWGAIVSRLLATGDIRYKISSIYLEFWNGTGVAPVPALDRGRGVTYYLGLADSASYDYLRVPIRAALVESSGIHYPKGNEVVFTAKSGGEGLSGLGHNMPFGSTHNSVIIGAALVAEVAEDDASQDLVLSAFYFPTLQQQPKLLSSEVAVDWQLTLQ